MKEFVRESVRAKFRRMPVKAAALSCMLFAVSASDDPAYSVPVNDGSAGVKSENAVVPTRFSLSVHDAPMAQVFGLLGAMTPLRFRFASPPDAVLSADVREVVLLPTLETLLSGAGWRMQQEESDLFLFRKASLPTSDAVSVTTGKAPGTASFPIDVWHCWNSVSPPPKRWAALSVPAPLMNATLTSSTRLAIDVEAGVWDVPSAWQVTSTAVETRRRPGISVLAPASTNMNGKIGENTAVEDAAGLAEASLWMRCYVPLRFVPHDLHLLIETPYVATFYVNGAPVLARCRGLNVIDLSRVLQRGANVLALHWPHLPRDKTKIKEGLPAQVLLRYEWLPEHSPRVQQ